MPPPPLLKHELRDAIDYLMERTALHALASRDGVQEDDEWFGPAKEHVAELLRMIPVTMRVNVLGAGELTPCGLERWVCHGLRRDGGRCGHVLMEIRLENGIVRVKCPRCDTWHIREVS